MYPIRQNLSDMRLIYQHWIFGIVIYLHHFIYVFGAGTYPINPQKFIEFPEELPIGTVVARYSYVTDAPPLTFAMQENGGLSLYFLSISFKLQFNSTSSNLSVVVASRIDREVQTDYSNFKLVAIDAADIDWPALPVLVNILDINDNAPQFDSYFYRCSLEENNPNLTCAVMIVTDPDEEKYALITNLKVDTLGPDAGSNRFQLSTTAAYDTQTKYNYVMNNWNVTLNLSSPLDYELQRIYELSLTATDPGGLKGTAAVVVTVIDMPDMPPTWISIPYVVTINEMTPIGTEIIRVMAEDGDRMINNPINFSLINSSFSSYFSCVQFNNNMASIQMAKLLNREQFVSGNQVLAFQLNLQATERSTKIQEGNASLTSIAVTVADINNYPPTFSATQYNATILENTPKDIPLTMSLPIEVVDLDTSPFATFTITLEKDNTSYNAFYPSATTIVNTGNILIRVNDSSILDYETNKKISFQIRALSQAPPYQSAVASVTLSILDVNDNSPIFNQSEYAATIPENSPKGTSVLTVFTKDIDEWPYNLTTYSLTGRDALLFSIDSSTGLVQVNVDADKNFTLLDRENPINTQGLSLMVIASNVYPGSVSQYAQLRIILSDVNDNAPQFTKKEYQSSIVENQIIFDFDFIVQASDMDAGQNAQFSFFIDSSSVWKSNFSINQQTGQVTVTPPGLDYEKLPVGNNGTLVFTVFAIDKGIPALTGSAMVKVILEDANDNPPIFNASFYTATVNESYPVGSVFLQIFATDADKPNTPNSRIVYSISSGGSDRFIIDSTNGSIRRSGEPLIMGYYNVSVVASDRGIPQNSVSVMVYILINWVNSHPPVFTSSLAAVNIKEGMYNATVIGQILATDPDANAVLNYSLIYSDMTALSKTGNVVSDTKYRSWFRCNNTGHLLVTGTLSRDFVTFFELPIWVVDLSADYQNPPQTATSSFLVTVVANVIYVPLKWTETTFFIQVNKASRPSNPIYDFSKVLNGSLLSNLTFQIVGDIKISSPLDAELQGYSTNDLLIMISSTGMLLTGSRLYHQTSWQGYFYLVVQVSDGVTTLQTNVTLFLLNQTQQLILVFPQNQSVVASKSVPLASLISTQTQLLINVDSVLLHQNADGSTNSQMSDLYLHGKVLINSSIADAAVLLAKITSDSVTSDFLNQHGMIEIKLAAAVLKTTTTSQGPLQVALVSVASGLCVLIFFVLVCLFCCTSKYRSKLKEAKAAILKTNLNGVPNPIMNYQANVELPGTNVYKTPGSNPLWDLNQDDLSNESNQGPSISDDIPSSDQPIVFGIRANVKDENVITDPKQTAVPPFPYSEKLFDHEAKGLNFNSRNPHKPLNINHTSPTHAKDLPPSYIPKDLKGNRMNNFYDSFQFSEF